MGNFGRIFSEFKSRPSSGSESTSSGPTAVSPQDPVPSESAIKTTEPPSTVAQPKTDPISDTAGRPTQPNATLENLPAELRREILDALGFESMRALVHASPTFHQQYCLDRRTLLRECLQRTLGAAAVDACAAYRSGLDAFLDGRCRESVAGFLKAYQNQRTSASYSILDEALTESEAASMVAFHFTIVEPFSERFTSWALGYLTDETGGSPHHKPPSTTEKARIMRAIYRFQLFCHLFHDRRDQYTRNELDEDAVVDLFFSLFEPWEVEEVVCVYNFVKDGFDRIFRDIHWDLKPENPRFADDPGPPTPTGAFDFDNALGREDWLGGTAISGLELLHNVQFKMRDHEHLVTTMQENISFQGHRFDDALSHATYSLRRRDHPSERDLKELAREPLPFVGDLESCPPLAWTLIWKGTYSNLYGDDIRGEMYRWGYVMWDAARMETEGGKALLLKQWNENWDERP